MSVASTLQFDLCCTVSFSEVRLSASPRDTLSSSCCGVYAVFQAVLWCARLLGLRSWEVGVVAKMLHLWGRGGMVDTLVLGTSLLGGGSSSLLGPTI